MRRQHALGLGLALLLAAGCGQGSTTPTVTTEEFDLRGDQVLLEVEQILTKDGVRTAVLQSDTAFIFDDDRRIDLSVVRLTFYDEFGAEAGHLTSANGEYRIDTGAFTALGDVVLITEGASGERRLETDQLYYDVRSDVISTSSPFTLTEAGRVSRGTSFRSNSDFTIWEVTGAETQGSVRGEGITF